MKQDTELRSEPKGNKELQNKIKEKDKKIEELKQQLEVMK